MDGHETTTNGGQAGGSSQTHTSAFQPTDHGYDNPTTSGVTNRADEPSLSSPSNGHSRDPEAGLSPPRRKGTLGFHRPQGPLPFKERAMRVTWAWFPCTMSTGALASLIAQQPFTFRGLETIGKIFYIVTLVLFASFSLLIAIRFLYKPRALTTSLHHPSESFFFGAWWVTLALILNGAVSYGLPDAGPWLADAMRVLFWMYFACAVIVAVFQYHVIFEVEKQSLSDAVPAWILPAYPFLVTGTLAATVAETQESPAAVRMIIAGIMGQGLGWILALFIYVVYLTRLIHHNMPSPSTRPGMYVSVGPAAYTCAGLLSLGDQAQVALPAGYLGITSVPVGDIWRIVSVPAALFLWLVAIWFSALSTVSILRVSRQMSFSPQWWAFVFPNAGLGLATIQIGEALDTDAIRAVGSGITVILVGLWFFCAVAHIRAIWNRDILDVGKDLGVEAVNNRHDEKKLAGRWTETDKDNL